MDKKIQRLIQSVASYVAIVGCLYFALDSWPSAVIYGVGGFTLFAYIVNTLRDLLATKGILATYQEGMEVLKNNLTAAVNCAYCGKINAVWFTMGRRNEFKCEHCEKNNLLIINASTAQITVPVTNAVENRDVPTS
jgi:uncharacterized Zn-finger protein